jgi:hypothetical protein
VDGTITLPGVGEVKRQHALIGGAACAGIVGVAWLRRGRGDVADAEAEYAASEPTATEGDYGSGGYAAGVDSYVNPGGSTVVGGSPVSEIDPDSLPPSTNSAWTQRSIGKLADVGWDAQAVAGALGRYLGRQTLANAGEVEIVRTAIAMVGPPPVGDFSILMPTTAPAPSGSTTPAKVALAAPTGLKVDNSGTSYVTVRWTGVPGAVSYLVGRSGTTYLEPSSLDNRETIKGLKPATKYTFTVRAVDSAGVKGPVSAGLTVTTKSS